MHMLCTAAGVMMVCCSSCWWHMLNMPAAAGGMSLRGADLPACHCCCSDGFAALSPCFQRWMISCVSAKRLVLWSSVCQRNVQQSASLVYEWITYVQLLTHIEASYGHAYLHGATLYAWLCFAAIICIYCQLLPACRGRQRCC
jgi:hypothetical protein